MAFSLQTLGTCPRVRSVKSLIRNVEGIVEMMLDATQKYASPLTEERLFSWHGALFPTGRRRLRKLKTGAWRAGGMEVVSGPEGKQKIHFEAPAGEAVVPEMKAFLTWYEDNARGTEPLIKAGLTHLYFVTIHPFEDGNGHLGHFKEGHAMCRLQRRRRLTQAVAKEGIYWGRLESTGRVTRVEFFGHRQHVGF